MLFLIFTNHNAQGHVKQAKEFFAYFAQNYGSKYPNIIYETFNEPLQVDWNGVKSYHEQVVAEIRKYDNKNVIVLGSTTWSQDVDTAANNPVRGSNLCYSLHYYAATHKQNLRDKAQAAINKGACIFVTEYGTVDASGGGGVDEGSTKSGITSWIARKFLTSTGLSRTRQKGLQHSPLERLLLKLAMMTD
uniref:Glycoside hydrolase family 5 domain-containing protein n=1 Tax=Meloidogyne enterolobii TaxID=390850 RepID=A0A6V7UXK7_MELEN|nr:unnamed protein product [Meloidogyne enterolobii]